ncbi:MAG: 3-oxoacyl-[acyl-carrier-protein] synthase III C-terminal domain-containing protein [Chloroflexota bacterium]
MNTPIGILATAYYLPPTRKAIADVFRDEEIPAERLAANVDFQRDIGIEAIHVADQELPSGVGLKAAQQAVEEAGLDPREIDLILDFTSIPEDYPAPTWSAAGLVQRELGATKALATAVNTGGCASYHVALKAACALLSANDHLNVALLFSGDKTPALNHTYYPITVTCDGGSAVILKKNHSRRVILAVEVATVGQLHDVWYIPGFSQHQPGQPADERLLYMTSDIQRFNENVIPINFFMFRKVMKAAMKRAGLKARDIDYYIYPTFSTWDQKGFCQSLLIAPEKVYTAGLRRHGHLQENDMVMNYVDAANEGYIREGHVVMVTTNGAGFTWGAALIRH